MWKTVKDIDGDKRTQSNRRKYPKKLKNLRRVSFKKHPYWWRLHNRTVNFSSRKEERKKAKVINRSPCETTEKAVYILQISHCKKQELKRSDQINLITDTKNQNGLNGSLSNHHRPNSFVAHGNHPNLPKKWVHENWKEKKNTSRR